MNARIQDATRDADGILRWKTNGCVPPHECLVEMGITGPELAKMDAVRHAEDAKFLAEYANRQRDEVTAEQRYEMEATFGRGATVVNVFTGRVTKL